MIVRITGIILGSDLVAPETNGNSIRAFLQGLSEDVDLLGVNFYEKGGSVAFTSDSAPAPTTAGSTSVGMNGNLTVTQLRELNTIATEYFIAQKPLHILLAGYLVTTTAYTGD